jgi:hypothetical protein
MNHSKDDIVNLKIMLNGEFRAIPNLKKLVPLFGGRKIASGISSVSFELLVAPFLSTEEVHVFIDSAYRNRRIFEIQWPDEGHDYSVAAMVNTLEDLPDRLIMNHVTTLIKFESSGQIRAQKN